MVSVFEENTVCDLHKGIDKFQTQLFGLSDAYRKFGNPLTKAREAYENFSSLDEYSEAVLEETPNFFRDHERERYLDGLRRAINDGHNSPDAAVREDARKAQQNMEDDGTWNGGNTACDDHSDANPDKPTDTRTVRVEISRPIGD